MGKRKLILPTDTEEAKINAGIAADPDTYVMSDQEYRQAQANAVARKRGRPMGSVAAVTKKPVTMRFDPDLVEAMRASGPGWQTRANDVLRKTFMRKSARQ